MLDINRCNIGLTTRGNKTHVEQERKTLKEAGTSKENENVEKPPRANWDHFN